MRRVFIVLLVIIAILLPLSSAIGEDTTNYAVVNNPNPQDRLNLRVSPNTSSKSLGKFYNGTVVECIPGITSDNPDWVYVKLHDSSLSGGILEDIRGWMNKSFLVFPGNLKAPMGFSYPTYTVIADNTPYRFDRSINDPSRTLAKGTSLYIIGIMSDGWALGGLKDLRDVESNGLNSNDLFFVRFNQLRLANNGSNLSTNTGNDEVTTDVDTTYYVLADNTKYRWDINGPNDSSWLPKGSTFVVKYTTADGWAYGTSGNWTSGDYVYVKLDQLSRDYVNRIITSDVDEAAVSWAGGYVIYTRDIVDIHALPDETSSIIGTAQWLPSVDSNGAGNGGYGEGLLHVRVLESTDGDWVHVRIPFLNVDGNEIGSIIGYIKQNVLTHVGGNM